MDEHNANPILQKPPPYIPDMQPIDVLCGQLNPPGTRSAKVRGPGQISFSGGLLQVQVKAKQVGMAAFFAPFMPIGTSMPISLLIPLLILSIPIFPVWYALSYCMRMRTVLHIDPAAHGMYYMQEKKVACLRLPDGRWIAIWAKDKDRHGELWLFLISIYHNNVILCG